MLSDRPIGRLNLPLPGLFFTGRSWPLDELPFETSPLLLIARAGLSGVVKLPTKPMTAVLSGSMSAYAEVTLGAATMTLLVGGSIEVQAEATLATVPMTLLAGGNIGVLSELNEVFVMNITGGKPGGTTQYKNYEFNSVAKIGGRYYGASSDGLFLLDGEDDAGEPVEASFGLGQLDFGSPQLKTVAHCYLGSCLSSSAEKRPGSAAGPTWYGPGRHAREWRQSTDGGAGCWGDRAHCHSGPGCYDPRGRAHCACPG